MYSKDYPWEYYPDPTNPAVACLVYPSSDGLLFRTDDARLMAAAPDLLAALDTLMHDIKCRGHYISDHALWAAQQAVARATGGDQ